MTLIAKDTSYKFKRGFLAAISTIESSLTVLKEHEMADDPKLVELLKFYKGNATVTRPEVGLLTGKTVGAIAGVCNRGGIKNWPKIPEEVIRDRPCQFPILKNGERHICGKAQPSGSLCCSEHQGVVWDPDKEDATAVEDPALAELLQFYCRESTVTKSEVGTLTGKTLEQIEEICRSHSIGPWRDIPHNVAQDRHCQFPILKNGERRVCGLFRSLALAGDPLRCSDHAGLIWDPEKK